ncbi:MAG: hypothetical protein BRC35_13440 [Cyanobacteria bacterium QH_10_48_56]|nr:MAG: hypothetical protein BRC35_13440 [Cyanobacteria bacterium QH_10_48_56]
MAVVYSNSKDLRQRALRLMVSGRSISRVSRLLDVSGPTLYKWRNQAELHSKSGSPIPSSSYSPPKNSGLASISRICSSTW